MLRYFLLLITVWQWSLFASAQTMPDTLKLQEVVVYGIPEEKYAVGSKIFRLDSLYLENQQSRSVSDVLIRKSPVYFKEYGRGMLSTVSFRGTSANHTAVLWNGLNLNQPNLGQTDFSLIPLFAIEDVSLQYGGSSALYGSDAIGGTVYLQSASPQWNNDIRLKLQQELGSFGDNFTGLAAQAGIRRWSFNSKVYHRQTDNDFEYINTAKKERPLEKNRNARFKQNGLVQDIAYRLSNSSYLNLKSWYQETARQIQPAMGEQNSQDQQEDKNLNISLDYKKNSPFGFLNLQLGHLYNYLLYNQGSEYKTRQYIFNGRYEKQLHPHLQISLGAKANHIIAHIEQYPEGSITENRSDLFASLLYKPFENLKTSLNLRQALVSGYTVPFTPSLGLEYVWYKGNTSTLESLASGGRSYRVPTLNDRFWEPGGNIALRPENSWNVESSLRYLYKQQKTSLTVSTTAYHMWVDDWILWLPGSVAGPEGKPISAWTPQNIQEVNSKGIELSMSLEQSLALGEVELGGNYAYTRSINKKAKNQYDRTVEKQLPFVPVHKSNAFMSYRLKSWSFMTNWVFVGTRYTTGEELAEFSVPAYDLFDCSLGKSFNLHQHLLHLNLEVRNILDQQYQNYENRAMPGRNFTLSAKFLFNQSL